MKRSWLPVALPRRAVAVLLLLAQIALYAYFIFNSSALSTAATALLWLLSVAVALCVITKKGESAYKLTWIFFILSLPLFGAFMYLLLMSNASGFWFKNRIKESVEHARPYLNHGDTGAAAADGRKELRYLSSYLGFPACEETEAEFLPSGEAMFSSLKEASCLISQPAAVWTRWGSGEIRLIRAL